MLYQAQCRKIWGTGGGALLLTCWFLLPVLFQTGLTFLSGMRLPSMVDSAVNFLGDLNTPLAMVVIGGQMASTDLGRTFRRPDLYASSILKLIVIPLITALLLLPFRLPALVYCSMVILAGTPTAGTSGILAQQYNRDVGSAAQLVTLSTLLSVITLPVAAVAANLLS